MNLKEIRKSKGISQIKLAKVLDVSKNHMSRLENEITDLSTNQIIKLCDFLNVTADELLGRKPYKEQAKEIVNKYNTNLTAEDIVKAKETLDKMAKYYESLANEEKPEE